MISIREISGPINREEEKEKEAKGVEVKSIITFKRESDWNNKLCRRILLNQLLFYMVSCWSFIVMSCSRWPISFTMSR